MADIEGIAAAISAVLGTAGGVAGAYVKAFVGHSRDAKNIEAVVRGAMAEETAARERLTRRVQDLEDGIHLAQESRLGRVSLHDAEELLRGIRRDLESVEKTLSLRIDRVVSDHRDLELRFNEYLQGEIEQWKDLQREMRDLSITIEALKLQGPRRR